MENRVFSPLAGNVVQLEAVNDEVFSKKMMGDGIAIYPNDGRIYAPFNGKITLVFPTLHAIGITSNDGLEILIHIGIDTFEMNGEGFEPLVTPGMDVLAGEQIMNVNFDLIKDRGYDPIVMIVCVNSTITKTTERQSIAGNELLFEASM